MQVLLNQNFYDELVTHYHKSMTANTFHLGEIHCWAYKSDGLEFPEARKDQRIFCFTKPNGKPIYSYVGEDVGKDIIFDTVNYQFVEYELGGSKTVIQCDASVKCSTIEHKEDCAC